MALPKTEASKESVQLPKYTNSGKMPEYNLAIYIVGVLAAQGLIDVTVGQGKVGYENFENATQVVYDCLQGIAGNPHDQPFAGDQVFDFVMSKP